MYPPQSLSFKTRNTIIEYTEKLAKALNVIGMVNIQYVLFNDQVYVIESTPDPAAPCPTSAR